MNTSEAPSYRWLKLILLIMAFLSFGVIFVISTAPTKIPKTSSSSSPPVQKGLDGQVAPNFTLKTLTGETIQLSDLKGKVVFLNFWATWCAPCKEEMPSMERLYQKLKGQPFEILAISVDQGKPDVIDKFFETEKIPHSYHVMHDSDEKISKGLYKITGVPETFILDREGKIVRHVLGSFSWDDPQIVKFFEDMFKK